MCISFCSCLCHEYWSGYLVRHIDSFPFVILSAILFPKPQSTFLCFILCCSLLLFRWLALILVACYGIYFVALNYDQEVRDYVEDSVDKYSLEFPSGSIPQFFRMIVKNNYFIFAIYIVIVINAVTSFADLVIAGPLSPALDIINNICRIVFVAEMVMKWIAFDFFV